MILWASDGVVFDEEEERNMFDIRIVYYLEE